MAVPAERLEIVERMPLVDVSNMTADEVAEAAQVYRQDALLADETRLSREVVMERCLRPAREYRNGFVPEKISRFGDATLAYIRPGSPLILPQIRKEYSMPYITMLGRHISRPNGQLQNSTLAMFDDTTAAARYLEAANEYFDSEIGLDEFTVIEKIGRTGLSAIFATVAGHTRQLAIGYGNKLQTGHPNKGKRALMARIFINPEFADMLEVQAAENSGLAPAMWERSRSIVTYVRLKTETGELPRTSDVAEMFNVDDDQIARAIRFESLPEEVKQFVARDKLPYSGVFEMDRLLKIYTEKDVIVLARRFAERKLSSDGILAEIRKHEDLSHVPEHIRLAINTEKFKPSQVKRIAQMAAEGFSESEILDLANWITVTDPLIDEVDKRIREKIAIREKGMSSLYDDAEAKPHLEGDTLSPGDEHRVRIEAAHLRAATSRLASQLTSIQEGFTLGLIGDTVEGNILNNELAPLVDKMAERLAEQGEIDEGILNRISMILENYSKRQKDPALIAALKTLEEVMALEEGETASDQAARLAERTRTYLAKKAEDEQASFTF